VKLKLLLALPFAPSLLIPAIACAGDDYGGAGGGAQRTPLSGGAAAAEVAIVAVELRFAQEQVEAPAGQVTVLFDNRDEDVLHNIHVVRGDRADGETVAQTDIKSGPATDRLTMALEPGAYSYVCDVHPERMRGVLTATG